MPGIPRRIAKYIDDWHHDEWCVAQLPGRLRAILGDVACGPSILGACHVRTDRSVIAMNSGLVGSWFWVPILAHECAHVMLGKLGVWECVQGLQVSKPERQVWNIAAALAIPERAIEQACAQDIARSYMLPLEFVRLRIHGDAMLPAWQAALDREAERIGAS